MTDIIRGLKNQRISQIVERGEGTLSSRYLLSIDGENYFGKTFRHGDDCFGRGSREMVKNEIAVQEYIHAHPQGNVLAQKLDYRGYAEIRDVTVILFRDNLSWRNGETLDEKLGVTSNHLSGGENLPTSEEIIAVKKSLEAVNYKMYGVSEVLDIIDQVARQLEIGHNLSGTNSRNEIRRGIIHLDVTPKNIMITTDDTTSIRPIATVIDYGIARERDAPVDQLFNKAIVTDVKGNGYYSAQSGIFNLIYSPIGSYDGENVLASPSMDIFNIRNLMCLMLTGRLPEYWADVSLDKEIGDLQQDDPFADLAAELSGFDDEEGTRVENVLFRNVVMALERRCEKVYAAPEKNQHLATQLARIIVHGNLKINGDGVEYESCSQLIADLQSLGLKATYKEAPVLSPILQIPAVYANYVLQKPQDLEGTLKSQWSTMRFSMLQVQDTQVITEGNHLSVLENAISTEIHQTKSINTWRVNEQTRKKEERVSNYTKLAAAALVLGIGGVVYFTTFGQEDLQTDVVARGEADLNQTGLPAISPVRQLIHDGFSTLINAPDATQIDDFEDLAPRLALVSAPASGIASIAPVKLTNTLVKRKYENDVVVNAACGYQVTDGDFKVPPHWLQYSCKVPSNRMDSSKCISGGSYVPEPRDVDNWNFYKCNGGKDCMLVPCIEPNLCCPPNVRGTTVLNK